jgi:hypothetical protein
MTEDAARLGGGAWPFGGRRFAAHSISSFYPRREIRGS